MAPQPFSILFVTAPDAGPQRDGAHKEDHEMLWTIAVILLVLWFLGLVSSYTIGGFIHLLLVLAIIMVLIRIIQGRRAL